MQYDRSNFLVTVIQRAFRWLRSLINRASRTKKTASNIATPCKPSQNVNESRTSPITTFVDAQQTLKQSDNAQCETQLRTNEAVNEVAVPTTANMASTCEQISELTLLTNGDEVENEPPVSGLPTCAETQVGVDRNNSNDWRVSDKIPPVKVDGAPLVSNIIKTLKEKELEPRHDDSRREQVDAAKKKAPVVPPEKRGGQPRGTVRPNKREQKRSFTSTLPRPEVVCWKRTREWVVGIEISDDIVQSISITVWQGDTKLSEDDAQPGIWPLNTLNAADNIQVIDAIHNRPIYNLQLGECLLFKLGGRGLEHGRKVKRVVSGLYLVIVPNSWRRDEKLTDPAPTSPEPVFLEGYQAHFFEGKPSSGIAFYRESGESVVIDSGDTQFHLIGQKVYDESATIGPLFGVSPPRLGITNGDWSNVKTIVVGQEGSVYQRWRKSFNPKKDEDTQNLPQEVLNKKAGWYFVRFYDSDDTLIDSLDFRFVAGLKSISVLNNDLIPSPEGHIASTVEILHDNGYSITHTGHECRDVRVEYQSEKTILIMPPRAACDFTRWSIHPKDSPQHEVTVGILVERIWWALGTINAKPEKWTDRPIELRSEDFAATSNKTVWLRFPKPRWIRSLSAGFRREHARSFSVLVANDVVAIPLRDFAGAQELDNRTETHDFKVWLATEQCLHDVSVAVLPSEEVDTTLDLGRIAAHSLATVLTRLRHATLGPTRQLIKEVRRKYHRGSHARPSHNVEFVKKALCLIAVLTEYAQTEQHVDSRWLRHWRRKALLALRENPSLAQQIRDRLGKVGRR